ncbi:MAG: hypothetical protein LBS41_06375 [Streptococcaceae bacterium]|nr:hypothetical protein [Streptococcaceae bacterium]
MVTSNYPKVVSAEMLPNNIIFLRFEDDRERYLPSHYNTQYVNAWAAKSAEKGTRRVVAAAPTLTWVGNEFKIEADGTLVMNDKDRYSPEELWEASVVHLTDLRQAPLDASHWRRNLIIALAVVAVFVMVCIGAAMG